MPTRASQRRGKKGAEQSSSSQDTSTSEKASRNPTAKPSRTRTKPLRSSTRIKNVVASLDDSDQLEIPIDCSQTERNLQKLEAAGEAKLDLPDGFDMPAQSQATSISQRGSSQRRQVAEQRKNYAESDQEEGDENDGSYDTSTNIAKAKEESRRKLYIPTFAARSMEEDILNVAELSQRIAKEIKAHCKSNKRALKEDGVLPVEAKSSLKHCPFCKQSLPKNWHKNVALRQLMQHWLDRHHESEGGLGATDTVALCTSHRDLKDVIPKGYQRKWPRDLDFVKLKQDVLSSPIYLQQMRTRIENPESSDWFCSVKAERQKHGRRFEGGVGQMSKMDDLHAGYYGELGYEVLHNVLVSTFMDDRSKASHNLVRLANMSKCAFAPLSAQDFLQRVLIPEMVCMLIQQREEETTKKRISIAEAKRIRDESQQYGVAMFPIPDAPNESDEENGDEAKIGAEEEEDEDEDTTLPALVDYRIDDDNDDDDDDDLYNVHALSQSGKRRVTTTKRQGRNALAANDTIAISSSSSQPSRSKRRREDAQMQLTPSSQSPSRPRPRPSSGERKDADLFSSSPNYQKRAFIVDAEITRWTND